MLSNSNIKRFLEESFNDKFEKFDRINSGYSSLVFKASNGEKAVFIVGNKEERVLPVELEAYWQLDEMDIPVPKPLHYSAYISELGMHFLMIEEAKGVQLSKIPKDSSDLEKLYFNAGEILKKLHSIDTDGAGPLQVIGKRENNNPLKGIYDNWSQHVFEKYSDDLFDFLLEQDFIDSRERKSLLKARHSIELEERKAKNGGVFVHNDYHAEHLFGLGGRITGVIDIGSALSAPAMYGLAKALYFLEDLKLKESFIKGYSLKKDKNLFFEECFSLIASEKLKWSYSSDLSGITKHSLRRLKGSLKNLS